MKRTGPMRLELRKLIDDLRRVSYQNNAPIWKRVAEDLAKPSRQRRIVNVYKIEKYAKDNETIVVPGKVLGVGELRKKVVVAAFDFSSSALEKINKVGKAIGIRELLEKNPKGSNVRIIG